MTRGQQFGAPLFFSPIPKVVLVAAERTLNKISTRALLEAVILEDDGPSSARPISPTQIKGSPFRHQLPFAFAVSLADTTRQEGAFGQAYALH